MYEGWGGMGVPHPPQHEVDGQLGRRHPCGSERVKGPLYRHRQALFEYLRRRDLKDGDKNAVRFVSTQVLSCPWKFLDSEAGSGAQPLGVDGGQTQGNRQSRRPRGVTSSTPFSTRNSASSGRSTVVW